MKNAILRQLKCVLSIKESNFNAKMGQHIQGNIGVYSQPNI